MALYEITADNLHKIEQTTFGQSGVYERGDLQRLLKKQIEVVLPDILIIAEEFGEWEESRRRIDLLGIDKSASLVVIELKRTEDGGHMELQAIRYAAMVAEMTFETAVETFRKYRETNGLSGDPQYLILEFLGWPEPDETRFAQDARIVLLSSNFSKELTTAVMWLTVKKGIDIRCIRLVPYADNGRTLIDVQQIIPLPEAADYQVKVRSKEQRENVERTERSELGQRRYSFWQAFIDNVDGEIERGRPATYTSNRWRVVSNPDLIISMYTAKNAVGIFVRRPHHGELHETDAMLQSRHEEIAERLGVPFGDSIWNRFADEIKGDYNDPIKRIELIDWLAEKAELYERVLKEVFQDVSDKDIV